MTIALNLALIGGEEFADGFESVHAALLTPIADGKSHGVFLPTNASHDGLDVVKMWCRRSQERLSPYAAVVDAPLVIDTESANDPTNVALLDQADWIYLGGGFPHIGMGILQGTRVLVALQEAVKRGALLLGASAGAMMMCSQSVIISPELRSGTGAPQFLECLGLIPRSMCIPHFDRSYAQRWQNNEMRPPAVTLIGIDEQTALVTVNGNWTVMGRGAVTLFAKDTPLERYRPGQTVTLAQ